MTAPRCETCVHCETSLIRSNFTGTVSILHYCKLKMAWLNLYALRRGCHLHKPFEP